MEAILIFSHGMHLSKFCAENVLHLLLFPLFVRLADGILANNDGCEESAVKWTSEVKMHSHLSLLRRLSVLRLD